MKLPWLWIVIGVCAVVGIFMVVYGGQGLSTLKERLFISEKQSEIQKDLEQEVAKLDAERDKYIKELAQRERERAKLINENNILKSNNEELKKQLASIVIPTDPIPLSDAFRKRGYHPTVRNVIPSR